MHWYVSFAESMFVPHPSEMEKDNKNNIYVEFKILAARHFAFHVNESDEEHETSLSEIPDLNNTLCVGDGSSQAGLEYPKLLLALATTRGISIFNARSGESEFCIRNQGRKTLQNPLHFESMKV